MRFAVWLGIIMMLSANMVNATRFEIETVEAQAGQDLGMWASLALDSHDNPHVAYHDATFQDLKYALKVGETWNIETVDSGNLTGWYASIAVDANDAPHIAYYNAEAGILRYAEKTSGVWATETVPDVGIYGTDCSIAIDHDNDPVIAYRNSTSNTLVVVKKDGGIWTTVGVSGLANIGFDTDIAVGPDGFYYVSHGGPSLFLFWTSESGNHDLILDGAGDVGNHTSIAVGPDGGIHISYYDANAQDLKYISNAGASNNFQNEIVDPGGIFGTGEWTSIALDEAGDAHIAYFDADDLVMRYAKRQGIGWDINLVDNSIHAHGDYSSLVLDSQGNPRFAYHDFEDSGLRYASGSVTLTAPAAGATWAVGSVQEVSWFGAGQVDVWLSTNGTEFDYPLATDLFASPAQVQVPHVPTRFARVRVQRNSFFSSSDSDSFFTIDASVILGSLKATPDGGDVVVTWKTEPGPEANIRYRVSRSLQGGTFVALHGGLLDVGEYVDTGAPAGALYRVVAVNGLGEEIILGDVRALPEIAAGRLLMVTPNPMRSGDANVLFRAHPGVPVQLQVYDVRGALVRTIFSGDGGAHAGWVRWDGTDRRGVQVRSGVYFVRLSSPAGLAATERLVLVR